MMKKQLFLFIVLFLPCFLMSPDRGNLRSASAPSPVEANLSAHSDSDLEGSRDVWKVFDDMFLYPFSVPYFHYRDNGEQLEKVFMKIDLSSFDTLGELFHYLYRTGSYFELFTQLNRICIGPYCFSSTEEFKEGRPLITRLLEENERLGEDKYHFYVPITYDEIDDFTFEDDLYQGGMTEGEKWLAIQRIKDQIEEIEGPDDDEDHVDIELYLQGGEDTVASGGGGGGAGDEGDNEDDLYR